MKNAKRWLSVLLSVAVVLTMAITPAMAAGADNDRDEISEDTMQSVSWYKDGISYSILNSNYNDVSKEDMIKMAKDIINK